MPPPLAAGEVEVAQMRRRAIVACLIGNLAEFYDFTIFGFFAIHIGRTFFPSDIPIVSLLASLATFGVGFAMRPIGGLVMGAYADRAGRKSALIITMSLMAVATGLIGLLPGYEIIGIWAPIILVLCRLAQGFSTGGEWGGAVIFLIEHASPGRRGFYASWSQAGIVLGTLFGSASALMMTTLLEPQSLNLWGWRIPFLIGFVLMPIGYYLRSRVDETPAFERLVAERKVANAPVRESFVSQKGAMFQIFAVAAIWTAAAYVLFVYLPSFAVQVLGVDLRLALTTTTIGSVVALLVFPFAGIFSDRHGRKPIVQAANFACLFLMYPLFLQMQINPGFTSLLATSVVAGILLATFGGAGSAMLTELVPTQLRSTSVGVGYNVSVAVFGGFAPFICAYLVRQTGQATAPAFFLMACSLVSIFCLMRLEDRANVPLDRL